MEFSFTDTVFMYTNFTLDCQCELNKNDHFNNFKSKMETLIQLEIIKKDNAHKANRRINFRLDDEMAKQLRELHGQSGLSQSLLIRIGLRNLFDEVRQYGTVNLNL